MVELIENKKVFGDSEYTIMSEIAENKNVTQRELSKKLGVSLSTVNVLINKMIREGLIKMTQVSQKQVLYMLTPVGMMEKAKKTISYLKIHYRAIYEMREKIKNTFVELLKEHDMIMVIISQDEIGEVIQATINEFKISNQEIQIIILRDKKEFDIINAKSPVLVHMVTGSNDLIEYMNAKHIKIINLIEYI